MILSTLLAAVEAKAPEMSMPDKFGLEPKFVAMQAISFLILFAVLYYFAIKPVIAKMDERKQAMEAGLKHAEAMKAKLDEAQQSYEATLRDAHAKAQQVIAEASKTSKDLSERSLKEATERANDLFSKTQAAIELEKKKMLAEARTEIARLVVATTQKVLSKELTDAERGRFNEAATKELSA
jgi:F-type H+-transporting ATPase subunit b